jgi:hypothetical protein
MMDERPSIPAEVRRQVLVEAGHRCAIQTCRDSANLDLHHITPLAEGGQTTVENLIAICPNCHRLADRGKIDRQSLHKYKEICQKLVAPPQRHAGTGPTTFIKFNPHTVTDIRDSENISSLVDNGVLDYSFMFNKPFQDSNYVVGAWGTGSVTFDVVPQDEKSAQIRFGTPCPDLVRLEFKH